MLRGRDLQLRHEAPAHNQQPTAVYSSPLYDTYTCRWRYGVDGDGHYHTTTRASACPQQYNCGTKTSRLEETSRRTKGRKTRARKRQKHRTRSKQQRLPAHTPTSHGKKPGSSKNERAEPPTQDRTQGRGTTATQASPQLRLHPPHPFEGRDVRTPH